MTPNEVGLELTKNFIYTTYLVEEAFEGMEDRCDWYTLVLQYGLKIYIVVYEEHDEDGDTFFYLSRNKEHIDNGFGHFKNVIGYLKEVLPII